MEQVYNSINALVKYARDKLGLSPKNEDYATNAVLRLLGISSYAPQGNARTGCVDELLDEFVRACTAANIFPLEQKEYFCDAVMGCLMLQPQRVQETFDDLYAAKGGDAAMQWLYDYSVNADYVKKKALNSNPRFDSCGLVVTINKTKPEFRDPKKAASGNAVGSGYPKCSICHENEGFSGRCKCTLRTVDLTLDGEKWFWQYSPYGYFSRHGIAVNYNHTPMKVDASAFCKLMDFVDMFPRFFIGCNAALERIGGSVLAHDHFQGGGEILPMHKAKAAFVLHRADHPETTAEVVDWHATAIRIVSRNRHSIVDICEEIREKWEHFEDKTKGIIPFDENGRHNAVSPTVLKTPRGYEMSVILRSNVTSDEFPDGVFHAHPQYHMIKKESIGLIEAQGLFILPGRLEKQLGDLAKALESGAPLPESLSEFRLVYDECKAMMCEQNVSANQAIKSELGSICTRILRNTAVFDKYETVKFLTDLGWSL